MRLEIDTTVSAPRLSDDAELRASADSAEARSALNQGIKAAQAGDRTQARNALSRATQLDPQNESAWLWLASISEYPEELLGFLNHVLEINPENQRAVEWKTATHTLLSKTFVQRGIDASDENKKEFAAECFRTALEYNDQNAAAWMWLASLSDSDTDKLTLLERAVSIEPTNQPASIALETARKTVVKQRLGEAKTAAVAGNHNEAIRILDSLLCVSPDLIDAWMLKSHLSESFDEKVRCFESILRIDPSNVAASSSRDSLLAIFESVPEPDLETSAPEDNTAVESPHEADWVISSSVAPAVEPKSFGQESAVDESLSPKLEVARPSWAETATLYKPERESVADTSYEKEEREYTSEPFASFAEETTESAKASSYDSQDVAVEAFDAKELTTADYAPVYSGSDADDAWAAEPDHDDTEPETVAFAYDASSHISAPEYTAESVEHDTDPPLELDLWSTSPSSEPAIAMPDEALPEDKRQPANTESSFATFVETSEPQPAHQTFVETTDVMTVRPDSIHCPFCGESNDAQAISCRSCTAVLTLSDLELLLANQNSNKPVLRQAVERMERERLGRRFEAEELVNLGLGHLNLRNLQFGYAALMEASKLTPNNVVLGGQVNSLLIRLDEIKRQEEAQLKMPKGKSILVVDDSPTVRKLIAGKLEKCGHEVICATDGIEAIERLANYVPDLVLLDITMPRMDGYQVCKQIRSNPSTKDVTVVMISGKDGFFDKVRGRMAGSTGYITKPFGPETLMKAVEMYLSGEAPELDEV